MLDLSSMNDLMFPGLPPVNNDRRFVTASKTIHNETVPTPFLSLPICSFAILYYSGLYYFSFFVPSFRKKRYLCH